MKLIPRAAFILAIFLLNFGAAHVLHRQEAKAHGKRKGPHKKQHRSDRPRRLLDADFDDRLAELDEMGPNSPHGGRQKVIMMALMTMLVANLLGQGKSDRVRRNKLIVRNKAKMARRNKAILRRRLEKASSPDFLSSLMTGGDVTPMLETERTRITKFLREKGIKLNEKTKFNEVWSYCKDYVHSKFGLDEDSMSLLRPACKKFFSKMKQEDLEKWKADSLAEAAAKEVAAGAKKNNDKPSLKDHSKKAEKVSDKVAVKTVEKPEKQSRKAKQNHAKKHRKQHSKKHKKSKKGKAKSKAKGKAKAKAKGKGKAKMSARAKAARARRQKKALHKRFRRHG